MLGLGLAVATLITEDGALVTGSLLVGSGLMDPGITIFWLVAGIVLGDIGLYGVGSLARSSKFVRKNLPPRKLRKIKNWLKGRQASVLFFSRFLPGTRLPTYLAFGYLRLSLLQFTSVMFVAGLVWVTAMVLFVSETQKLLSEVGKGPALAAAIAVALFFIVIAPKFVRRLTKPPPLDDKPDD